MRHPLINATLSKAALIEKSKNNDCYLEFSFLLKQKKQKTLQCNLCICICILAERPNIVCRAKAWAMVMQSASENILVKQSKSFVLLNIILS